MKRYRITRAIAVVASSALVACFLGRRRGRPKEAREKLGGDEAQFRTIFEGMAVGVALVDARGRLVESNSALEEMLGYAGDELRGLHFVELTHL
jgi:PAS domain-containing protein